MTEVPARGHTGSCDSLRSARDMAHIVFPNFLQVSCRKEGRERF